MIQELSRCLRAFDRTVERSLRDACRKGVDAWQGELTNRANAIHALLTDPRIAPAIDLYMRSAADEIAKGVDRIRTEVQDPNRQQVIIDSELVAMRYSGYRKSEVVDAVRLLVERARGGELPPVPRSANELWEQIQHVQTVTLNTIRERHARSRAKKKERKRQVQEGSTKIMFGVSFVVLNAVMPTVAIASLLAGAEKIAEGARKLAG